MALLPTIDVSSCDNDFSLSHDDTTNSSDGMSTCFNIITANLPSVFEG